MNNNKVLIVSFLSGLLVGSIVIFWANFNHFEASIIGLITMFFTYVMLRMNRLDALVGEGVA